MTDPNPPRSGPDATDFGYERVPWNEKQRRVRGVFDSVARNYDLMNDLMSGGAHRLWKEFTLSLTHLRPGQRALDVAGGTGDLTTGLARQVGNADRRVGAQQGDDAFVSRMLAGLRAVVHRTLKRASASSANPWAPAARVT